MCDTLCVRTNGAMLFAKNSDRDPDEAQVVEWHGRRAAGAELRTQYLTIDDPGAHAFLGSRPTWLWGVEHGVNEHGVAIGNEKIWTVDRPGDLPPALLGMDLVRLGLERATTAEEALTVMTTLLERHGQGGSGEPHHDEPYFSSFLVADPGGGFVLETSNRTWAARPIDGGAAISNRVSLSTDWTQASADVAASTDFDTYRLPAMPTVVADDRLDVTRAVVARGGVTTPADLARTLRNHGRGRGPAMLPAELDADGHGFTVCMHRRESHAQTTASLIAELHAEAPSRTWASLGNPCVSVYVPCFPPAIAPELADTSQWRRFARLRDRVEAAPDELADVQAVLAAVERDLWAEAESAFAGADRAQLDSVASAAFAPVDAALHRLGV
jgi:dipeptidase